MSLSHAEAQQRIFRGWARLCKAMEVGDMTLSSAHEWERNMLREVHTIFSAVVKGPSQGLVVPPLARALLDAQRSPERNGPITPAVIHLVPECNDTDLPDPSTIDLGDPSTFWWVGLGLVNAPRRVDKGKGKDTRPEQSGAASNPSPDDILLQLLRKRLPPIETLDEGLPDDDDRDDDQRSEASHSDIPPTKKQRVESQALPSKDAKFYTYVPKCQRCRETGRKCIVQARQRKWGQCEPCRVKKSRCSVCSNPKAYRIIKMTHSSASEKTSQRVSPDTSPTTRPLNGSSQGFKVGPPGGKWMWEKRAAQAATRNQLANAVASTSVARMAGSVITATTSTVTARDFGVATEGRTFQSRGQQTEPPGVSQTAVNQALVSSSLQIMTTVNTLREEIALLKTEMRKFMSDGRRGSVDASTGVHTSNPPGRGLPPRGILARIKALEE